MLRKNFAQAIGNGSDQFVTIAAGQSASSTIECYGMSVFGLYLPFNWTSCTVSFQIGRPDSPTSLFWAGDYDGTEYQVDTSTMTLPGRVPLVPGCFHEMTSFRIICHTNQSLAVTVFLGMTPLYQGVHG